MTASSTANELEPVPSNRHADRGIGAVAVVVPAYRVREKLADLIRSIPSVVKWIIVVDDACPEGSGDLAAELRDPRVEVLRHDKNRGVGGATKTGMQRALELNADYVLKLDGDGQMDPAEIPRLLRPLINGKAALTKGNRFWHFRELRRMPIFRRLGNLGLSFLVKIASGHWNIFDPTNGYIAIRTDVLRCLVFDDLSDRYFFEISLLTELGKRGFKPLDLPIASRYEDEQSSLSVLHSLLSFPFLLFARGVSRIWYRHFWFDFTMTALLLLVAVPLTSWSILFGGYTWWRSVESGVPATAGTVMLAALPFLVGINMLLQAIGLEVGGSFNARVSPDDGGG